MLFLRVAVLDLHFSGSPGCWVIFTLLIMPKPAMSRLQKAAKTVVDESEAGTGFLLHIVSGEATVAECTDLIIQFEQHLESVKRLLAQLKTEAGMLDYHVDQT